MPINQKTHVVLNKHVQIMHIVFTQRLSAKVVQSWQHDDRLTLPQGMEALQLFSRK